MGRTVSGPVSAPALYFTGPRQVEIWQEETPPPGPGQARVRTLVSAISAGTELLLYRDQMPVGLPLDDSLPGMSQSPSYPLKYGYAAVGEVESVGEEMLENWIGRRVFAFQPHQAYFLAEATALQPVPASLSMEAALFLPNMETAISLAMDGTPVIGERVLVFGQGVVGLLLSALLVRFPLGLLIGIDPIARRQEMARALGVPETVAPDELAEERADLCYELSGNPAALNQAITHTGFNGRVVIGSWYGQKQARLDLGGWFHRSHIRLIASQVSQLAPQWRGRWDNARRLRVAWQMLDQIPVTALISHRFAINEAAQAYVLLDQRPEEALQVVLTY